MYISMCIYIYITYINYSKRAHNSISTQHSSNPKQHNQYHINTYTHMYMYMYMYIHTSIQIYIYTYMYTYLYICTILNALLVPSTQHSSTPKHQRNQHPAAAVPLQYSAGAFFFWIVNRQTTPPTTCRYRSRC